MESKKESPENQFTELVVDSSASSIDDFIKELEAKERDLHISSDLVVEIEDSEIDESDSFEILQFLEGDQEKNHPKDLGLKSLEIEPRNENVFKLENEVEKLRKQVSKFEVERLEVNEIARRRQYDFDNYRKRTE